MSMHAVLSLSSSHRSRSTADSHRQRDDSNNLLPGVSKADPFNVTSDVSPKSGQLTTCQTVCGSDLGSSEDGSPSKPVRILVCILNESSQSMLVPSFMHLQISVIVQFAVGFGKVQEALIQNEKVGCHLRKRTCL